MKSIFKKLAGVVMGMVLVFCTMGCSNGSSDGSSDGTPDYSSCTAGDFILKDGSVLSKDSTPASGTVAAVIVRAAGGGKPHLELGLTIQLVHGVHQQPQVIQQTLVHCKAIKTAAAWTEEIVGKNLRQPAAMPWLTLNITLHGTIAGTMDRQTVLQETWLMSGIYQQLQNFTQFTKITQL